MVLVSVLLYIIITLLYLLFNSLLSLVFLFLIINTKSALTGAIRVWSI